MCARTLFKTKKFYSYRKSGISKTYNTVVILPKSKVQPLFSGNYIKRRDYSSKYRNSTTLAVIKSIPLGRLTNASSDNIAEFLSGWFDSDGSIRPKCSEMSFALDTQISTRKEPLAYRQIELLKMLSKQNRVPRILSIEIRYPRKLKERAYVFYRNVKPIFSSVKISESRKSKGVRIRAGLSCDVRRRSINRLAWMFWIENVVPRLIRKDKKSRFIEFYKQRKRYFQVSFKRNKTFYKYLATKIESKGSIVIRTSGRLQCEVKIRCFSLKESRKLKRKVESFLYAKTKIYKE